MRASAILLVSILLAVALRFPDLGRRPMHADEGVHADKFGTLLEGGGYVYDPTEYHGPTLYYLTLPSAWLRGETRYVDIDETTLRAVPAAFGVALVALHLGARPFLGAYAAALAALLAAISPAMVFYSRYYIHEVPLVFFTFATLLAAGRYLRSPGVGWAVLTGACVGLMHATKETAPLALGSMLLALGLARLTDHGRDRAGSSPRGLSRRLDVLLALTAAFVVSTLLFTSFLSHPGGLADSLRTYSTYIERSGAESWHIHRWDYYLRQLLYFPAPGAPLWTEGLILLLAVIGGVAGWTARGVPGADSRVLRFLAFYTLVLIAVYSAIPYKTPWCVLGFLHGMVLLAGAGALFLVQSFPRTGAKVLVGVVLSAAAAHLGWQAFAGSFRFAADPRNPWVYAQTSTDVFTIVRRLDDLSRAHPDGASMPIQVVSRENLWPLPWYLRQHSRVEWWTGIADDAPTAPVVVLTPDMEEALVRKLYDLPPPGERELYVSIFERPVELRPQVELRGYARNTLWESFRRREAASPVSPRPETGE